MVSLMNDMRLAAGKPVLGFLNPFLYMVSSKDATAFNDIKSGDNVSMSGVIAFLLTIVIPD